MGYRSDVKYVIDFTSKEAKIGFLAQVRMIGGDLQTALDETNYDNDTARIFFAEDNVKWYDSYPEVQAHDKLLSMAEEQSPEMCNGYHFVRLGEEFDDIETRYAGENPPYDSINIHRSVDFD